MFDSSSKDVNNLVHRFVQNLGIKMESVGCTKAQRINYIAYVDTARKMKRELLRISEKTRDILTRGSLDFSDIRNIQSFIERRTNLFDKSYVKSAPLLAPHLKNINRKITEKVTSIKSENKEKSRKGGSMKLLRSMNNKDPTNRKSITERTDDSTHGRSLGFEKNTRCSTLTKGEQPSDRANSPKRQSKIKIISKTSQIPVANSKRAYSSCDTLSDEENKQWLKNDSVDKNKNRNLWWIHKKKENIGCCNLTAGIMRYTQRQTELNGRYLELQMKDADFRNQHVRITLHVAIEKVDTRNFRMTDSRYCKVLMLCKEAILSLIEPSERAVVAYNDNLSALIKNHLTRGYKCHFTISSAREDYYSALLILSHWAAILVRHPNTTLLRTISYALGCSPQRILVLSCPEDSS